MPEDFVRCTVTHNFGEYGYVKCTKHNVVFFERKHRATVNISSRGFPETSSLPEADQILPPVGTEIIVSSIMSGRRRVGANRTEPNGAYFACDWEMAAEFEARQLRISEAQFNPTYRLQMQATYYTTGKKTEPKEVWQGKTIQFVDTHQWWEPGQIQPIKAGSLQVEYWFERLDENGDWQKCRFDPRPEPLRRYY